MVRVFYSERYVGSGYSFATTRKSKWLAYSLEQSPIAGLNLVEPKALTEDQVLAVHSPEYVRAVQTGEPRGLAESQGFPWDGQLWPMVPLAGSARALAHQVGCLKPKTHHWENEAWQRYGDQFAKSVTSQKMRVHFSTR